MSAGSITRGITQGFLLFTKMVCKTESPIFSDKLVSAFVIVFPLSVAILLTIGVVSDSLEPKKNDHGTAVDNMSPTEHLAQAKAECGNGSLCLNPIEAAYQISMIPSSAPEYGEASKLLATIMQQESRENAELLEKTGTEIQKSDDAEQRSREQMQRNFQGEAHDSFSCATSTEKEPIVSFDDGKFWWKDDGRCAEREQKRRDEDAQIYSYWPNTVRVNTDMDSFWLPDEERNCQTLPDDKGRVSTVICDTTAHANHNIPVTFWGGVDRNTVSDWRCRREGGSFVCRATD